MAKRNVYPEGYHSVRVKTTDGKEFEVQTSWGKENDILVLDVDPYNHPAWKKEAGTVTNAKNDMVVKFKKKYGNIFN